MNFKRILKKPTRSFFLLGPRATGKSTWLKQNFKNNLHLDLLRNETYFLLSSSPNALRERVLAHNPKKTWIILDEIQRLPILLNEVHSLIEDYGYQFALTGSSARKLKRGNVNLLAGRALMRNMFPLTAAEYGETISLEEALSYGTLPNIITDKENRIGQLEAYVGTYLREEIKEEAVTRNVQSFSRFLEIAGLMNGQVSNLNKVARDSGIPRATVSTYFEILMDTLLGFWLPAWKPRAKVKEQTHPKFYFFDCGVLRGIQKLLRDEPTQEERGILFETLIFHELNAYISYHDIGGELFYWRTADNIEIDFIYKRGKKIIAIDVKSTHRWKNEYENGFKSLLDSKIKPTACYAIYTGTEVLKKDFGLVLSWKEFIKKLNAGEII